MVGCNFDPPTSPTIETPIGPGGTDSTYIARLGVNTDEGLIFPDSTAIVAVKKNVATVFSGNQSSQIGSINFVNLCMGQDSCVNAIEGYRIFTNVGDTFLVSIYIEWSSGHTSYRSFRIYIVNSHDPGGDGDLSLKSQALYNNGMRVYEIYAPTDRVEGSLQAPYYLGPPSWNLKKITKTGPGVFIIPDTCYDGKFFQFNYMGDSTLSNNNWSNPEGSRYFIGDYLYGPVFYGGNMYVRGTEPVYELEGIGDSIFRVFSRNDSVCFRFDNIFIPGITRNLNSRPQWQYKIGNGSWSSKKNQVLQGSSGWGGGGIKIASLDTTYLIHLKFSQGSVLADMRNCFAYDPNNNWLTIAFIGGDTQGYICALSYKNQSGSIMSYLKNGEDLKDLPKLYPQSILCKVK